MFQQLPEEVERIIYKFYYSKNVVEEIKQTKSVWYTPSDNLVYLCRDSGCIQHSHTDMEKVLLTHRTDYIEVVHDVCFKNLCLNCVAYGFPCMNACYHGGFDPKLLGIWNMEYYEDKI